MSLRLWTSILAGVQVVTAGTALFDVMPAKAAAIIVLLVAGLQAGTARYMGQPAPAVPLSPAVLGKATYTAYGDGVGWRNFEGDQMPAWEDLPQYIRQGWAAAATAAKTAT